MEAAEACIRRFGANKVSINDIAESAGIGRMTVYRTFENRGAILAAIVIRRMSRIAQQVKEALQNAASFEDAVVKGSILTIELAEADELWQSISQNEGSMQFDQLLLSRGSIGDRLFMETWQSAIDLGRNENKIRTELTDEQVAEWVRHVHFLLIHRPDLSGDQRARFIKRFALPALSM